MALMDDIIAYGLVLGLLFAAWKFKIKPELDRRKETNSQPKQSTVVEADYKQVK